MNGGVIVSTLRNTICSCLNREEKDIETNYTKPKTTQPNVEHDNEKTYIDNFNYATYNTYDDHERNTRIKFYVLTNCEISNLI